MIGREMMGRLIILGVAVLLAVVAAWLIPRVDQPPDRFAVAFKLIGEGRADEAAYLFEEPVWRGVAQYRAERFNTAVNEFFLTEDVRNYYNMGTAYARLHQWPAARAAYRKALSLEPQHADTLHNLGVVVRAEAREKELVAASRNSKTLGTLEGGDKKDTEQGAGNDSDKVEQGGQGGKRARQAKVKSDIAGRSDQAGLLGEPEDTPGKILGGPSGGRSAEDIEQTLTGGAGQAAILQESRQAAEVLLKRIKDNPARVLAARLKAIHRQRREEAKR